MRRLLRLRSAQAPSAATILLGPAGFEPATCRRGDRTTGAASLTHRGPVRSCKTAPFLRLRRGSRSIRCKTLSMEFHVALLWSDRRYAGGDDHQRPDRNRYNVGLSCCSEEHRHKTYSLVFETSGRRDLNPRPLEPHSSALPSCATARFR